MRRPFSYLAACFSVVALGGSAFAQEKPVEAAEAPLPSASGPALSEREALVRFERDNLDLVAAKYDLSAARAGVVAAGVLPNPTLGVGGAFLVHGTPLGGEQELSVFIGQSLPIGGQVGAKKDAAAAYSTAAERDFAASLWSLTVDVRQAYLGLALAEARFRIERAALRDLTRVETVIEARAQGGANPQYDRIRVSVDKSSALGRMADAEAELATARATLAQAVGKSVDARTVHVDGEVPEPQLVGADLPTLVERAVKQRPEAAAAKLRSDASALTVTYLKRTYVPSPQVTVGYTHGLGVPGDVGKSSGGVVFAQLAITLPIFDHGQGTIDRGLAEAQAQRTRAEAIDLFVRRDVERAYHTAAARVAAWQTYRDAAKGGVERLREIAELSYREGRATILELLDAYSAYREARIRATELKGAALRATTDLERAVGPKK